MNSDPTATAKEPSLPAHLVRLTELDEAWRALSAGERLTQVRKMAPRLRERIIESGQVACVRTYPLAQLPYPTAFGLAGALRWSLPYLIMTNRCNLVQFETLDGERK